MEYQDCDVNEIADVGYASVERNQRGGEVKDFTGR